MLFLSLLPSRETMRVNLLLDLIGFVRHEDTSVSVTGTHFGLGTLQRREEFRVNQGGLRVFELLGDISSQAEIRILVDSTGYQAGDIGDGSKHLRERI